ncbi:MAG TPA: AraC family transcriptional regulator [Gammaproteobacteria bacterium]|nr:AraC family transcriptional regulator [Gammaproteobacteria bacterium]
MRRSYAARSTPHADSVVRTCQLLAQCYREADAIQRVVGGVRIPERTLKRRFKAATGSTFIDYVQNLRIEEAKRLLETTALNADEIGARVGYEDHSFFRKLFRRLTGVRPGEYRRLFQPVRGGALGPARPRHPGGERGGAPIPAGRQGRAVPGPRRA